MENLSSTTTSANSATNNVSSTAQCGVGGLSSGCPNSVVSSGSVIVQGQAPEDHCGLALAGAGAISEHQQHHQHSQSHHRLSGQQHHSSSSSTVQPAAPSPAQSPALKSNSKTCGRNNNGTMVSTSSPSNEAELQLYRVLQRASLLAYYDTLLEMGGDDVQQLCDAGEEEFLEIMALVGMASKPLHVRRLQKSLHEWAMNPASFQAPLSHLADTQNTTFSPEHAPQSRSPFSPSQAYSPPSLTSGNSTGHHSNNNMPSFANIGNLAAMTAANLGSPAHHMPMMHQTSGAPSTSGQHSNHSMNMASGNNALSMNPTLNDMQMSRLAVVAEEFSRTLPPLEPKPHSSKKRSSKDLEQVLTMNECDPRRMDEIRKYAAIYGRFDCKRRPEKPLSVHELCVNEAATQICKYIPALLFRRDELFHHARKIVRKAGFGPSAGVPQYEMSPNSNSNRREHHHHESTSANPAKRMRLGCDGSGSGSGGSDFTKETAEEMRHNLLAIYQKLGKTFDMSDVAKFSSSYPRSEYDDNDSTYSFSNSSSPPLPSLNGGDHDFSASDLADDDHKHIAHELRCRSPMDAHMMHHAQQQSQQHLQSPHNGSSPGNLQPHGVHVISASGGHIIAVTNPALAMSTALSAVDSTTSSAAMSAGIKRERMSPGPCDM